MGTVLPHAKPRCATGVRCWDPSWSDREFILTYQWGNPESNSAIAIAIATSMSCHLRKSIAERADLEIILSLQLWRRTKNTFFGGWPLILACHRMGNIAILPQSQANLQLGLPNDWTICLEDEVWYFCFQCSDITKSSWAWKADLVESFTCLMSYLLVVPQGRRGRF